MSTLLGVPLQPPQVSQPWFTNKTSSKVLNTGDYAAQGRPRVCAKRQTGVER